ncbi:TRAP transporter substrate-binding protein [Pokkaliibacter sp. MBI-7]|uniref:TRAP transporter substrate-binding protein n=1 Tax=Pokkaliibacter sp. MBI-7 TaxID=3040600 RepID=UPI00244A370C|nr:TRAP transporter substrate-binding protein [Pokkaliibacter sp. MBI-7]MDH2433568.1 TRAP transporter substrate-binding protein [Pokkaliibacter sp. MBI-7]
MSLNSRSVVASRPARAWKRAALGLALACAAGSASATTTLRFAHIWPTTAAIHKEVFQAWADTVEKESNGELKVQIFPAQTLTKSDTAYQGVVNGIADITAIVQGYTAGRFPLSQVVELPGVSMSARQGSCITQSLYDEGKIASEYADSHVLYLFASGPGYIHTSDKVVKTPEDLQGLRIRRPTAVVGKLLSEMGAQPVGLPAPEIYSSMQRGLLDGVAINWEGLKTFRVSELSNEHTEVPFYSLVFVTTMNKKTYDRLPDNLKKVIDDNSGMKWAMKAGTVFAAQDAEGRAEARGSILEVKDPLASGPWAAPLKKATEGYLDELNASGKNATEVYDEAKRLQGECAI